MALLFLDAVYDYKRSRQKVYVKRRGNDSTPEISNKQRSYNKIYMKIINLLSLTYLQLHRA